MADKKVPFGFVLSMCCCSGTFRVRTLTLFREGTFYVTLAQKARAIVHVSDPLLVCNSLSDIYRLGEDLSGEMLKKEVDCSRWSNPTE